MRSLAGQRGQNWALPDEGYAAVPISRPVRVIVSDRRLEIMTEKEAGRSSASAGQVIPLEGRIQDSIDEFVSALWEHMKAWGIAGGGPEEWKRYLQMGVQMLIGAGAFSLTGILAEAQKNFDEVFHE